MSEQDHQAAEDKQRTQCRLAPRAKWKEHHHCRFMHLKRFQRRWLHGGIPESTRQRVESSQPKEHEDHIAGEGNNPMTHYNQVHKFSLLAQAMKIPDAKSSSGQGMEEARDTPSMGRRLFSKHKETKRKFTLLH